MTEFYAWTALVIIILTYGMETGFFRFAGADKLAELRSNKVYSTTLTSIAVTSTLFAILICVFQGPISKAMGYVYHPEWVAMMGVTVAIDAFNSIPFAYLRFVNRPFTFAKLKIFNIIMNIILNIFFLVLCPRIYETSPEWVFWFYSPAYGVGYVFVSNLISSAMLTIALLAYVFVGPWAFDRRLLVRMLKYSLPLLLFGVAGIMDQTIDKMLFKSLYKGADAMEQLGIYGACFKVAMVMMMFTYAFKFAYEPFVFSKHGSADCKESYADAMKYYVITALGIFLGIVFYMDVLQYVIAPAYREGLAIIPVVLVAYLFQGVLSNLSLWYKLTDRTIYGAYISILGLVITVALNVAFVPKYSYWACVYATLACYTVMMLVSYFLGQKYYPVNYPLKDIGIYVLLTAVLYVAGMAVDFGALWANLLYRTALLGVFAVYLVKKDLPLSEIPVLGKLFKKSHSRIEKK